MRTLLLSTAASAPADGRGGSAAAAAGAAQSYLDMLLSEAETCALTGLAERTLQRKRVEGTGPKFVKLGRRILYRRRNVLAWIDANTHDSTSAVTVATQREGKRA